MHKCPDCFKGNIIDGICVECGFNASEYVHEDYFLPLFTHIGGKYIIGRVIGEGGFGITYTAFNDELNIKYAVKEYYPADISGRGFSSPDGMTIYPFSGLNDDFIKGLERFRKEAEQLARFDGAEGIVNVKDYICENGTGYIFMEFVSGKSLENYLSERGGRIPFNEALKIIKPVISALSRVHRKGIIHRDISPSNIIITEKNGAVLIDFGSSRQYDTDKSMSVILKHGYAPYEQYARHGEQDPKTDIYALCATIYRMITGEKPPDPIARIQEQTPLLKLTEICDDISAEQESAVIRGLAVKKDERTSNMEELYYQLYQNTESTSDNVFPVKKIIATAGVLLVFICSGVFLGRLIKASDPVSEPEESIFVTADSSTIADEKFTTEISEATVEFDFYTLPVHSGIPQTADEVFIKSGIINDLDTVEKNTLPNQDSMYVVKRKRRYVATMKPLGVITMVKPLVAYVLDELPVYTFSEYIRACDWNFNDEPLYSYIEDDFDHDGENEYYIFAEINYFSSGNDFNGETAFLVYYADDNGETSFVCNGIYTYPSEDARAFSEKEVTVLSYNNVKHLLAAISAEKDLWLTSEKDEFFVIKDSNIFPDSKIEGLKGEKGIYIRNGAQYILEETPQGEEQTE